MNLTSKSRYALKIMMDLAHYGADRALVRRGDIAARQGVPTDYLDQIMIKLRSGHLVESTRGRNGGYRLARSPEVITMWDLFSSVEDSMIPVECLASGEACDFETSCSSREAWKMIFSALKSSLSQISLAQLRADWENEMTVQGVALSATPDKIAVRECRGGGRADVGPCQFRSNDLNTECAKHSLNSGGTGLHG